MKALLVANGDLDDIQFLNNEVLKYHYDLIVCADGGVNKLIKLDIIPHLVMGDFDSIDQETYKFLVERDIKRIKYPKEKDETDTELVLNYLIDNHYTDITMIGCLGSRIDHTLVNIYLLYKLLNNNIYGRIINKNNLMYLINDNTTFKNRINETVSLIPLSDEVVGITTKGLFYPLKNASMKKDKPIGISNIIISEEAEVKIKKGELLIIISKDI